MTVFPKIETERLILSKLTHKDIPKIIEYAGHPDIYKATSSIPKNYSEKDAIFWLNLTNQGFENGTDYTFRVGLKDTGEFIGVTSLNVESIFSRAELGYWIGTKYWKNGYASESVESVLKYGFESLNLNKIFAIHFSDNPASGRVMIKNKMIKEAEMFEHLKKEFQFKNVIQYRLTKKEYENKA